MTRTTRNLNIQNYEKIIPDAYHGTGNEFAKKILSSNVFKVSTGSEQFLGDGVYFFENSPEDARCWGISKARKMGQPGAAVIRANLNLGYCLDFHNKEHSSYVVSVRNMLNSWGVKELVDAVVVNFICNKQQVDSVKASRAWPNSTALYSNSKFNKDTYIIISMRNVELISNIELVHEEILS